jgi:hypothetical protein
MRAAIFGGRSEVLASVPPAEVAPANLLPAVPGVIRSIDSTESVAAGQGSRGAESPFGWRVRFGL